MSANYSDEYYQGVTNVCALPNNPGVQKYARSVDSQKQPGTSLELGTKMGFMCRPNQKLRKLFPFPVTSFNLSLYRLFSR